MKNLCTRIFTRLRENQRYIPSLHGYSFQAPVLLFGFTLHYLWIITPNWFCPIFFFRFFISLSSTNRFSTLSICFIYLFLFLSSFRIDFPYYLFGFFSFLLYPWAHRIDFPDCPFVFVYILVYILFLSISFLSISLSMSFCFCLYPWAPSVGI